MRSEGWSSFSDFWNEGYVRVLALRVLGAQPGPGGARLLLRWFVLSTTPPAAGLAAVFVANSVLPGDRQSATVFVATLTLFNAGILASAVLAWGYVRIRATIIDDFFAESSDWATVIRPLADCYSQRLQLGLSGGAAAVPLLLTALLDLAPNSGQWIVAVVGAYTTFFMANVILWLLVCPRLILRLWRASDLCWRWNDPARTPAIRVLASAYGYAAIFVGFAALGVTLPGLFGSNLLVSVLPVSYGLLLLLALYVGAVTQWGAARTVRRVRLQMLDTLVKGTVLEGPDVHPAVEEIWRHGDGVESETLEAYAQIASGRNLPYTSTTVVEYFFVVATSLVSFLFQIVR